MNKTIDSCNPKWILLVDDEEDIRFILSNYLKDIGFEVEEATSALDGLEKIKKKNYHYIVTDLMMPQMNGDEFIHEAKKIISWPHSKFILVSGDFDEGKNINPHLYDGFISKPFNQKTLEKIFQQK